MGVVLLGEPFLNAYPCDLRVLRCLSHPAQSVGYPVHVSVHCHSTGVVPGNVHH